MKIFSQKEKDILFSALDFWQEELRLGVEEAKELEKLYAKIEEL